MPPVQCEVKPGILQFPVQPLVYGGHGLIQAVEVGVEITELKVNEGFIRTKLARGLSFGQSLLPLAKKHICDGLLLRGMDSRG